MSPQRQRSDGDGDRRDDDERNVASALGPAARKHQPLAELAIGVLIVARSRF